MRRIWLALTALCALPAAVACVWAADGPLTGLPDPFQAPQYQWATPAGGGTWGSTAAIKRGPHDEIWAINRCDANSCDGSDMAPINQLDVATGKPIRAIGAGLFVFPHGLSVDRHGNIWVTDGAISKDGTKGLQVIELSPSGKVLMRLGTAGVRGDDATHFLSPTAVITAPNGDIFVADGHSTLPPAIPANLVPRIMKFSKDGKFIKQWGGAGSGPSQFSNPHDLALDARGRLFVADRGNSRIQIFDQDGKFLAQWSQFGRAAGLYIDRMGTLYAIDPDSSETIHPGWPKGIWIGSVKSGRPTAFVPDNSAGEGVVVDAGGTLYGAVNVAPHGITRYAKR
jgi:sugar lactone lactonase YvrE